MIPRLITLALLGTVLLFPAACSDNQAPVSQKSESKFLIIAHRGASGYRPEHTLAAYQLAIAQGADFIEPDLVPTRDGHLIARHENALAQVELDDNARIKRDSAGAPVVLSATTDVAQRAEFAHLLTVRNIDGRPTGGWFSEDFTLAEIRSLYARERIASLRPDNTTYNQQRVPTLQQVIQLLQQPENAGVGMYPELKHPSHFLFGNRSTSTEPIGIDTTQLLIETLQNESFTSAQRLYIQCFEVATLRRLRHQLLPQANFTAPLVQLFGALDRDIPDVAYHQARNRAGDEQAMSNAYGPLAETFATSATYGDLVDQLELAAADYVSGLGPRKGDAQHIGPLANELGLQLHPYTIRAEPFFLSPLRGAVGKSVAAELETLRGWGATGVFIDQPDQAVSWRAARAQQTATTP